MRQLIAAVDEEFLPPLSARMDTLALAHPAGQSTAGLEAYLQALEREQWLLALDGEDLVGLLSFIPQHEDVTVSDYSPAAYVTTIAVKQCVRRAGIGMALYARLREDALERGTRYLLTRTWSTNASHLRLLSRLGFRQVGSVRDQRALGVDTVYLASEVARDVRPSRERDPA